MSTYKQPVNVPTPDISLFTDPNTLKAGDMGMGKGTARVSMGDPASTKINMNGGTKQRGSGAATKGFTSRGPMA